MKSPSTTNGVAQNGLSRAFVRAGRTLLLFAITVVVFMPLTEYYWTFDKFFRGGQDLEFGLLSLAVIFCLLLVLSRQRKLGPILLLALRRWHSLKQVHQPTRESSRVMQSVAAASPLPHTVFAGYAIPIQI